LRPLSSSAALRLPCPLVTERAICSSSLQLPLLSRPEKTASCMFVVQMARCWSVNESLLGSLGGPRATAAAGSADDRVPGDRSLKRDHVRKVISKKANRSTPVTGSKT
jgi:hypothetical protein